MRLLPSNLALEDYEKSINVMEEFGVFEKAPDVLEEVRGRIETLRVVELEAHNLGLFVSMKLDFSRQPSTVGMKLMKHLLEQGWTAPEDF